VGWSVSTISALTVLAVSIYHAALTVSIYHVHDGRYGLISLYTSTHGARGQYLPCGCSRHSWCSRSASTISALTVSIYHIHDGRYGLISLYTSTHGARGQYLPCGCSRYSRCSRHSRCSRSVSTISALTVLAVSIYHIGAHGARGQYLPYRRSQCLRSVSTMQRSRHSRCSRSVSTISATRQMVCALICDHSHLFLLNHG